MMTVFLNYYGTQMGELHVARHGRRSRLRRKQTEEPTQRRLDEAQAHGDIVKSQEVSTFIVLGGGTLAIAIFGPSAAEISSRTFSIFLEQPDQLLVDPGGIMGLMRGTLLHARDDPRPADRVPGRDALAAHLLQNRPSFAPERLMPDFSKISPLTGLKRLFGIDGVTNLLKGMHQDRDRGYGRVDHAVADARTAGQSARRIARRR